MKVWVVGILAALWLVCVVMFAYSTGYKRGERSAIPECKQEITRIELIEAPSQVKEQKATYYLRGRDK